MTAIPGAWVRRLMDGDLPDLPGALCASGGYDPDMWHPDLTLGRGLYVAHARAAVKVCHECPVMGQCRAWALGNARFANEGVWGGLTLKERTSLLARRRQARGA